MFLTHKLNCPKFSSSEILERDKKGNILNIRVLRTLIFTHVIQSPTSAHISYLIIKGNIGRLCYIGKYDGNRPSNMISIFFF